MKNFQFSKFLLFLLVVATALLAPSCNTTLKKASVFTDFNGTDTTEARYATAAPATDFEGIWLKVVDNGRVYPLPLCRVNYGRQTWFDENDGKWVGVTFYEDGYTWTEFYHSFKDEDDLDPTFIRAFHTDDYLVCSGGDDIAFPWTADEQREKTLTQFKVEWCRFGICELTTIVDGEKSNSSHGQKDCKNNKTRKEYLSEYHCFVH
jgi:hypothetical protein